MTISLTMVITVSIGNVLTLWSTSIINDNFFIVIFFSEHWQCCNPLHCTSLGLSTAQAWAKSGIILEVSGFQIIFVLEVSGFQIKFVPKVSGLQIIFVPEVLQFQIIFVPELLGLLAGHMFLSENKLSRFLIWFVFRMIRSFYGLRKLIDYFSGCFNVGSELSNSTAKIS